MVWVPTVGVTLPRKDLRLERVVIPSKPPSKSPISLPPSILYATFNRSTQKEQADVCRGLPSEVLWGMGL